MSDARELKLNKRKKAALLKTIEKNVFVTIDEHKEKQKQGTAEVAVDVADVAAELRGLSKTLDVMVAELKEYSDKIYDNTDDDDEFEREMNDDATMNIKMNKYRISLEDLIEKLKPKPTVPVQSPTTSVETKPSSRRAKPPDLKIPTFSGSHLEWDTFKETFDAIVGDKSDYTNVEKFQYLKANLSGPAQTCIAGFPVVGANYTAAYKLLNERFGNEHLVIQAHMKQITQVKRVTRGTGAELRKLSDSIQSHVRSLETKGVDKGHFGALLIPMIQEKIPEDVDLLISRKMGKESWNIDVYLKYLQDEVEARESCKPTTQNKNNDKTEKPDTSTLGDGDFTLQTLLAAAQQLQQNGVKLGGGARSRPPAKKGPTSGSCGFCKGDHYSDKCDVVKDYKKRVEVIKANNLCPKCLKHGHAWADCKNQKNCYSCKSIRHHTALCNPNGTELCLLTPTKRSPVVLQVASIKVGDIREKEVTKINVIFDSCSQRTYATERLVTKLGLMSIGADEFNIGSFAAPTGTQMSLKEYKLVMKTRNDTNFYLDVWRVPTICSPIRNRVQTALDTHSFLQDLPMANDAVDGNDEIDILIGADFYWKLVDGKIERADGEESDDDDDGFRALSSKFGWLLSGPLETKSDIPEFKGYSTFVTNAEKHGIVECDDEESELTMFTHDVACTSDDVKDELTSHLKNFFDLDVIGIKENERSVEEQVVADMKFDNGRFETALPRKEYAPPLETNYAIAKAHVLRTRAKQAKTPHVLQEYDRTFREWETAGIIERVTSDAPTPQGKTTYLTHRAVERRDKTTTKIRPVFNASLRGRNGVSLNDCLHKGPCMNPKLFESWMKFRSHSTAISADIEKAYLQIGVRPEDRDLMRFLWFEDGFDDNSNVVTYRFTRVFFGATCSQFLLGSTLRKIAENYDESDAEFARKVREHFYVDDLNTGVDSTDKGIETYETMKTRFADANFNLRKWRTNNAELQNYINNKEKSDSTNATSKSTPDKVLGFGWDDDTDELVISVKDLFPPDVHDVTPTKRNILRVIAGIWDIVGFLQPIIVRLKLLFMMICLTTALGWDDVIPDGEILSEWKDILTSVNEVEDLRLPRCYHDNNNNNDPILRRELHGFSDASTMVYGACVYMKTTRESGKADVRLVAAKSRIAAPSKKTKKGHTIPRLELLGNLILCRLMSTVQSALESEIKVDDVFFWSDSLVSLGWIKSWRKELKTFCQNRVTEIRRDSDMTKWNYVNTKENPADIITRTASMNIINDVSWLEPPFLRDTQKVETTTMDEATMTLKVRDGATYPVPREDFHAETKDETDHVMLAAESRDRPCLSNLIDIDTFDTSFKLFRITALVLRFVNNTRRQIKRRKDAADNDNTDDNTKKTRSSARIKAITSPSPNGTRDEKTTSSSANLTPTITELREAKKLWLKDNQRILQQQNEYDTLRNTLKLVPDDKDILRSACKLMNADIRQSAKTPIVLCRRHRLTDLFVWEAHRLNKHMSVKQTLADIRNTYWIPRGRSHIRGILHKCATCKRVNGKPYPYPTISNLPSFRTRNDVAFSSIGVDYAGPLMVKNIFGGEGKTYKCWIALYTCASTRGIILDVVPSLDEIAFVGSFQKFIARRGAPKYVISDNGKCFISQFTKNFALKRNITWEHIPEKAAWFGGFYERMVAPVKNCLKKTLGRAKLDFNELLTVLHEIELILNSKPLTYVTDDVVDDVLTPNHVLFGRNLSPVNTDESPHDAANDTPDTPDELTARMKYLQRLISKFWKDWRNDYLLNLREQMRPHNDAVDLKPKVDDVVLIHDDNLKRHRWVLGRVVGVEVGSDGQIRAARVVSAKSGNTLRRPISKLFPIV